MKLLLGNWWKVWRNKYQYLVIHQCNAWGLENNTWYLRKSGVLLLNDMAIICCLQEIYRKWRAVWEYVAGRLGMLALVSVKLCAACSTLHTLVGFLSQLWKPPVGLEANRMRDWKRELRERAAFCFDYFGALRQCTACKVLTPQAHGYYTYLICCFLITSIGCNRLKIPAMYNESLKWQDKSTKSTTFRFWTLVS